MRSFPHFIKMSCHHVNGCYLVRSLSLLLFVRSPSIVRLEKLTATHVPTQSRVYAPVSPIIFRSSNKVLYVLIPHTMHLLLLRVNDIVHNFIYYFWPEIIGGRSLEIENGRSWINNEYSLYLTRSSSKAKTRRYWFWNKSYTKIPSIVLLVFNATQQTSCLCLLLQSCSNWIQHKQFTFDIRAICRSPSSTIISYLLLLS